MVDEAVAAETLNDLLDEVAAGAEIVITRGGMPVAMLVPVWPARCAGLLA
jgi:prevent-host-death family protein